MASPTSPFWKRLSSALRDRNLPTTQGAVGKMCSPKVVQPAVFKWKSGSGLPTLDNAIQLARKAGVQVEWLLTGRGERSPSGASDPALAQLLELWSHMDSASREWLLQSAKLARTVSFNGEETKRVATEKRLARSR